MAVIILAFRLYVLSSCVIEVLWFSSDTVVQLSFVWQFIRVGFWIYYLFL